MACASWLLQRVLNQGSGCPGRAQQRRKQRTKPRGHRSAAYGLLRRAFAPSQPRGKQRAASLAPQGRAIGRPSAADNVCSWSAASTAAKRKQSGSPLSRRSRGPTRPASSGSTVNLAVGYVRLGLVLPAFGGCSPRTPCQSPPPRLVFRYFRRGGEDGIQASWAVFAAEPGESYADGVSRTSCTLRTLSSTQTTRAIRRHRHAKEASP